MVILSPQKGEQLPVRHESEGLFFNYYSHCQMLPRNIEIQGGANRQDAVASANFHVVPLCV
jgi:hypothetical protein